MAPQSAQALLDSDSRHVWHPYSGGAAELFGVVTGAAGVYLDIQRVSDRVTDSGSESFHHLHVIDGMSSWWAAIHGYRNPRLDAAARRQLEKMSHVMFGGLTHGPAVELAERLVALTPAGLERVFFSDSGSVSIEVAVKMALQFWRARGKTEKTRLLTWRGGYHGDTFTPMSVCDPDGGMHAVWTRVLWPQLFIDAPPVEFDAHYAEVICDAIERHSHQLAAVIVEPIVQGAGGMRFHHPRYLQVLAQACQDNGVLLIFDEIATGFGRTGELFGADWAEVQPDIMCLGKALTSGYLSLAATLCTDDMVTTISGSSMGALMHGPTFMANPLACAIANESLAMIAEGNWRGDVYRIEKALVAGLGPLRSQCGVRDVRVRGAIGVVEMAEEIDIAIATNAALDAGVWLRPFGKLLYTMPPFIASNAHVDTICRAMSSAVAALTGNSSSPLETPHAAVPGTNICGGTCS